MAPNEKINSELQVRVYSSEKRKNSRIQILANIWKDFPASHSLGFSFAQRNIRAQYRQSLFGVFWSFLPPIATSMLWIILSKTRIVNFGDNVQVPYPLFILTGTILWSVFVNSIMMPIQTMQANRSILVKINFPREALLVNAFYEVLFKTLISIILIAIGLVFYQIKLSYLSLYFIPCVFVLILMGMSIGIFLIPISVLYRDVQFAMPSLLQFAMYMTPVIYPYKGYSGAASVLHLNAVSPVLTNARAWLLGMHEVFPASHLIVITGIALTLLIVGIFIQRVVIEILIERMGS